MSNKKPNQNPAPVDPAAAEQFRKETEDAMAGDLMTNAALAPPTVAQKMPEPEVPVISEEIVGKSPADPKPVQTSAAQDKILVMLSEGKIDVAQAQQLLKLVAAPQSSYIGGAEGPATRDEIKQVVQGLVPQIAGDGLSQGQMLELMGEMVNRIVRGLREPSDEEKAALERKKQTRAQLIQEQFEMIQQQKDIQSMCPHERSTIDGRSHSTITAIHNMPDGILRGLCSLCQKVILHGEDGWKAVVSSHNLAYSAAS